MIEYSITLTNGEEIKFFNSTDDIEKLSEVIFNKKAYKIGEIVINVRHIVSVRRV